MAPGLAERLEERRGGTRDAGKAPSQAMDPTADAGRAAASIAAATGGGSGLGEGAQARVADVAAASVVFSASDVWSAVVSTPGVGVGEV